ncbi:sensor histidine kinase [Leptospira yasudae]|uniref:Sensor histidine kinase n=1 Tax=Leptospira yasudae TaxID=2202201 RepID=A0ABX9M337_9LEPT|nr:histidine kinase [Leptospira yasudae]RHX79738.1 sensor histidine kinase [Leptospira yasudae]RHX95475.1 sensor histidine kinase [Leptospira yasudae]TGK27010.1 sensor histidine kinase [Leptospira yasudae]TGM08196.1 sensor histidine kinase [Leptospira yasudae]
MNSGKRIRWFKLFFWFSINTVIGTMNALLIAHNSESPFWKVFLATQITTHFVCGIVEMTVESLNSSGQKHGFIKSGAILILASCFAAIVGVAAGGILHAIALADETPGRHHSGSYNILLSSLILALFISVLEKSMQILIEKKKESESALKELHYAALQSRMDPHYLFNTLNTIHALLEIDPARADRAILLLSDSYRFLTERHSERLVSFREEWEFTRNYLELQKIRFADFMELRMESKGDFSGISIPPLSIQPLVENSFKHSVNSGDVQRKIFVSAEIKNGKIRISIEDNGTISTSRRQYSGPGGGFGMQAIRSTLRNIQARLDYNFRDAILKLEEGETGGTTVLLEYSV